ncbi:MAG: hypothetical protein ABSF29_03035 [Tepidisphaeraceae bacterium]
MTWTELLNSNCVTAEPTSKGEIDNLRSIVSRSLANVAVPGLSADIRFILAYDAARTLSLMIVRAEGYRPRSVGGHYHTFLGLAAADPAFATLSAYFNDCRMIRNECEYDVAGGVTDTDVDQLLRMVKRFAADAETWIATRHAHLA